MWLWDKLDISFFSTTDVGDCKLSDFDTSFSVLFDDVAPHIRVALSTLNKEPVESTWVYAIFPDFCSAELRTIVPSDFNPILVASFNFIFDKMWLIVANFDPYFVQIELIVDDLDNTR